MALMQYAFAYDPPTILHSLTAGSTYFDYADACIRTSEGNYVMVGDTYGNDGDVSGFHGGYFDAWVVMFGSGGQILWQRTLGGSEEDELNAVHETPDGNLLFTGYTDSDDGDVAGNHGMFDYWVVKMSKSGDVLWQKCYGGTNREYCIGSDLTPDGGFILNGHCLSFDGDVTGNHGWDYWVVKADSLGNIQWGKCYGGTDLDYGVSVHPASDGGYIVGGQSYSNDGDKSQYFGLQDYWILKVNDTGNIEWESSFGGSDEEYCYDVVQTSDGGYIATGMAYSDDGLVTGNHGGADCWVVRMDSLGNMEWEKAFGSSQSDSGVRIREISGGFILLNSTYGNDGDVIGNHGYGDAWLVRVDYAGAIDWQLCVGGTNSDGGMDLQILPGGGFLIGGSSSSSDGDVPYNKGASDFWIFNTSPEECGQASALSSDSISATSAYLHWNAELGADKYRLFWRSTSDVNWNKITLSTDHVFLSGLSCNTQYIWKVRSGCIASGAAVFSDEQMFTTQECREAGIPEANVSAYPNPADNYLYIIHAGRNAICNLYDVKGTRVLSASLDAESSVLDISTLAKGLYFLAIDQGAHQDVIIITKN